MDKTQAVRLISKLVENHVELLEKLGMTKKAERFREAIKAIKDIAV